MCVGWWLVLLLLAFVFTVCDALMPQRPKAALEAAGKGPEFTTISKPG